MSTICLASLYSSEAEFSAYVDQSKVSKGQVFKFYIEISGDDIPKVEQPLLSNIPFENLGVSQSSSTSISIINGKMTSVKKQTYIYSLQAQELGTFTIPSIVIKAGKQTYKTNEVNITVTEAKTTAQSQQNNKPVQPDGFKASGQMNEDDIVFIAVPSTTNPYRNESFVVDYIIYTKYNIEPTRLGDEPSFSNFWKDDISGSHTRMEETIWKGEKYYSILIRRLVLSANKSGSLQIPSLTVYADVIFPSRSFWGFADRRSISLQSKAINIKVKDLPIVPNDLEFSGAVGDFKVVSNLSQLKLKAGEAATLTINISGKGNLRQTSNPVFPNITNLRVLGPEVETRHNEENEANKASRTLKYALLPQDEGLYNIPAVNFVYFDPAKKRYISSQISSYKLEVERGNVILSTANNQKLISSEGSDIGFIITSLSKENYSILFRSAWYWIFVILLILSIPIYYFYKKEQDKLATNVEYLRNRKAKRVLKKYLKDTSFAYKHQQSSQFYDSAYKGILLYLTDKLTIPRGSTQSNIMIDLKKKIEDEALIKDLESFLNECTEYKYSVGANSSVNLDKDYIALKNIVDGLTKLL